MPSIIKVPTPVKTLVEKFPLYEYPPTASDSLEQTNNEATRRFKFRPIIETKQDSDEFTKFNLGVYNISPLTYNTQLLSSLDPICFYTMLLLASKTKSQLPLISNDPPTSSSTKNKSSLGSVSLLSYHASVDGELPILIEDEQNKKLKKIKRKIRSTTMINKFNLSSIENPTESMFIKLLDTRVYDFFMCCILESSSDTTKLKLYSLNRINNTTTGEDASLFDKLTLPAALAHVIRRYNFNIRNPSITYKYSQIVPIKPKYFMDAIKLETNRCLGEGLDTLKIFSDYLNDLDSDFYFGNSPSVFDFKLAAFVYCLVTIDDCKEFKNIKQDFSHLIGHMEKVIKTVI